MGTPVQKLAKIEQTKSELKTAINSTGCPAITDSDTFASYSNKINDYLVYPQGTLPITENNKDGSPVDVTAYKYVDVNVPMQMYEVKVNGTGNSTITFTGIPNNPKLFVINIAGNYALQRNQPVVITCHNHGEMCKYHYTELTGGNAGQITLGDITNWSCVKQSNNTYTLTVTVPTGSFMSGIQYGLCACYTMQQR